MSGTNPKRVFVVTGFELGWDCVVGVFDASKVSQETLLKQFPEGEYYINDWNVEQDTSLYE